MCDKVFVAWYAENHGLHPQSIILMVLRIGTGQIDIKNNIVIIIMNRELGAST